MILVDVFINSSTSKIMGSISIRTAADMMNKSWNNISSEAIKNCFIKCNFSTDVTNDEMDDESINVNDLPLKVVTEEQFSIFVNFGNDLEESGEVSDL